jgi:hypothetical protein
MRSMGLCIPDWAPVEVYDQSSMNILRFGFTTLE